MPGLAVVGNYGAVAGFGVDYSVLFSVEGISWWEGGGWEVYGESCWEEDGPVVVDCGGGMGFCYHNYNAS